jgi:hypothetical protein
MAGEPPQWSQLHVAEPEVKRAMQSIAKHHLPRNTVCRETLRVFDASTLIHLLIY